MNASIKQLSYSACIALAVIITPVILMGCASTSTRESTGEYIDDASITAKVKAAHAKDPDVSAMQVNVETFKGVVQLSGFVDRKDQSERAEQLANRVKGVQSVKNAIIVKPAS